MKATDIKNPEYFHKVVDCQYGCPAHTPVPEYIRLIAAQRYSDAYMVNWESNVFPGILGRTCDRPCEPVCRRGRVEEKPVAICRLKRVAADNKDDVKARMPQIPKRKNGKKVALIGGGPASLTVARDLLPLGYLVDLYDNNAKAGGMMRSQIPSFRLPPSVLDEEVNYILDMGVNAHFNTYVSSLKDVLSQGYDAVFVGTGAPSGKDLDVPGREEAKANIHIGIEWLASVAFDHTHKIGRRVLVLGGGNTAMDCCRTAKRLGGEDVKIVVRSEFDKMKASPWEKEDAMAEYVEFLNCHVPKEFVHEDGRLTGMKFEKVEAVYDNQGRRSLVPTGEDLVYIECDDVLIAIGQDNAFPWIERDIGLEFNGRGMPVVDKVTFQSSLPNVFFGGDAAFGPENIITAVAQSQQAAISIDLYCSGSDILEDRPAPGVTLTSQKMGVHEWSYDNQVSVEGRFAVPHVDKQLALADRKVEVELGFDVDRAFQEAARCLNCDAQTVFIEDKCIECDACVDICPTDCINFLSNGNENVLRQQMRIPAKNLSQAIYASAKLKQTGKIMAKDENVCLHCGLCAERCPTGAWDMQKFLYNVTKAGRACAG